MNNDVYKKISYGVYVVSTLDGDRPTGCVANSIMQVTSSPSTIAISINHDNFTNSCIKKSGVFAISILHEQSDPTIIGNFGFQSGKDMNKFDAVDYDVKEGLPVIKNSCGYVICKVENSMEAATHTVFLGKVVDGDILEDEHMMTYEYYHNVLRGKSPKNAPTYISEEVKTQSINKTEGTYKCSICGYVYDGDIPFEELPDDYVCPICGMPKSKFNKE